MESADVTRSIDQGAARARFRVLKYTLQTLLFVAICAGGFMVAYRWEMERGYKEGDLKWAGEQCVPRSHVLGNLAGTNGLFSTKAIENMLRTGIDPTSWDTVGGPASIELHLDENGETVFEITQHPGAHDEIARILAELRAGADN